MSIHFRDPIHAVTLTLSTSGSLVLAFEGRRTVSTLAAVPEAVVPAQIGGPHLAALIGMIALALLGSALAVRNRLKETDSLATNREPRREEFMTDQQKVRQLISENGGRMKQSRIVESVDWSKAKVSRLLAELEEDGQITKLRLGRENLVCLPGHEPTASKSPEQPKNE
ncbi:helix-turn-helix transcriptional regulator [Halopiger djelfimassiliensis]|uniref:helix-turn-helix transcriptional regulator n=1 Tax=Halopiger djelfimassiliensis TaxID=1293047 RepID=UPI0006779AE3|nr:helix-turn-helix domain-containing protein [Halopiger djelfimassiliensis]